MGPVAWQGNPRVYRSSKDVERLFCGTCEIPMAYRNARDHLNLHLYAAMLCDPDSLPPAFHVFHVFHVFHGDHITWFQTTDDLPRHESMRS